MFPVSRWKSCCSQNTEHLILLSHRSQLLITQAPLERFKHLQVIRNHFLKSIMNFAARKYKPHAVRLVQEASGKKKRKRKRSRKECRFQVVFADCVTACAWVRVSTHVVSYSHLVPSWKAEITAEQHRLAIPKLEATGYCIPALIYWLAWRAFSISITQNFHGV